MSVAARPRLTLRDTSQTSRPSLNSSPTTLKSHLSHSPAINPSTHGNASLSLHTWILNADDPDRTCTPSSTTSMMSSGNIAPTLTPVTNNDLSPPERPLSPRSKKRSYDQMQSDSLRSPHRVSSDALQESCALTPTQTPPEFERHARPGPGDVKGLKLVFDPQTAADDRDKRKYKPKYMSFGDKVRAASNQVLLLT
jgi:hypothetical protein